MSELTTVVASTTKHYYAFYWSYGLRVGNFEGEPLGSVSVFGSRAERDAWVADEHYENGNLHREAIDAREARTALVREIRGTNAWSRLIDTFDNPSGVARDASVSELIDAWNAEVWR